MNMYSQGSHYNYLVLCLCSLGYMHLPVQTSGVKVRRAKEAMHQFK